MKITFKKVLLTGLFTAVAVTSLAAAPKTKMSKDDKALFKQLDKKWGKEPEFIDPKTNKPYDFGGMEVIVADWWSDPVDANNKPAKTKIEEDRRNWHKYLGMKYNFKVIERGIGSWNTHPQTVANYCVLGGDENYVFTIDTRSVTTGLKSRLFYDMAKNTDIDWNQRKYDAATKKLMTKKGAMYGCRPMAPEPRTGLFFNKRLLSEANVDPESIYDMQRDGTWTWENFEKVLKKITRDIDNDGVIDVWGMANHNTEVCHVILESNGGSVIKYDENDKMVNNIESEASIEAMTWGHKMQSLYEMPQPEGSEWNWMYAAFMNGKVAFLADQEYHAQNNGQFSGMTDDWGFVCFPLGPKGDGKYRTLHNDNMYVIPSCYDDERAAKIAKAFDFWTDDTPGYDGPESWKESFYSCFRDDRAVDETLYLMRSEPNPRYDTLIPGINYMGDVIWVTYPGAVTPQQAYEDTKNVWAGLLDDANR